MFKITPTLDRSTGLVGPGIFWDNDNETMRVCFVFVFAVEMQQPMKLVDSVKFEYFGNKVTMRVCFML